METESRTRRYLPKILWGAVILFLIYLFYTYIVPNRDGITLDLETIIDRLKELSGFLLAIFGGMALVEIFVYQIFFRKPKNLTAEIITRGIQLGFLFMLLILVVSFFELTDLIRLQDTPFAIITSGPALWFKSFNEFLIKITGYSACFRQIPRVGSNSRRSPDHLWDRSAS